MLCQNAQSHSTTALPAKQIARCLQLYIAIIAVVVARLHTSNGSPLFVCNATESNCFVGQRLSVPLAKCTIYTTILMFKQRWTEVAQTLVPAERWSTELLSQ
jgi:hypothetical protein